MYVEAIEELNAELKKEGNLYQVNTIKEAQKNDLLHILPAQLVVYSGGEAVDDLYNTYGWGTY